ncbi:unnamed protein product [Vitrella brassicaformis CCMP3155]|uniref:Aminotransferase class V domain-containing protein n=2 Tax=Vitrella brassicaformis TaxID=1169539 RepID=A0A0G4F0G4_VITBC|nr:unnamed protein product [Vitrella brassicaformis CCMP3155]|eukprot:CEM05223.1 unnamed protein product [Vitrella brassicaformis CCMP3155]
MVRFPLYNDTIRELAMKELARFEGHTYLDYTGSGVYQSSQLKAIYDDFDTHAYGNAHSQNPSADLTDQRLREARELLLDFFNADAQQYSVVFTSGATGALKMVGEDFPWSPRSEFVYVRVNHNSVLGIREYAYAAGATFRAVSEEWVMQTLWERKHSAERVQATVASQSNATVECLFAMPAKDNFAGMYYPNVWINDIQTYGLSDECRWRVLVDGAAYAPTRRFDLTEYHTDFLAISFYKMFGYPTGLGALLLRNDDARIFNKVYWGGGTVVAAVCDSRWCKMKDNPSLRFEDGTVSFLSVVALKYGLDKLKAVGMSYIEQHVSMLTTYLAEQLDALTHLNGRPVISRYGRWGEMPTGGIVNLNVMKPDGSYVSFSQVQQEAAANMIHLRTGCFCNPGACQDYLGLSSDDIKHASDVRESCSDPTNPFGSKPLGSVRVSLGYLSTFEDVDNFIQFIRATYVM